MGVYVRKAASEGSPKRNIDSIMQLIGNVAVI